MRFDLVLFCTVACLSFGCNRPVDPLQLTKSDNAAVAVTVHPSVDGVPIQNPGAGSASPTPVAVVAAKPIAAEVHEAPAKDAGWTATDAGDAQKLQPAAKTANRIVPPLLNSSAAEPPKPVKDESQASDKPPAAADAQKQGPAVELPKPSLPPSLEPVDLEPAKPTDGAKPAMPSPTAEAPASDPNAPPPEPAKPELSIEVSEKGVPALTVRFPWKEFARPSLQMALVGEAKPAPLSVNGKQLADLFGKLVSRLNKPVIPGSSVSLQRLEEFSEYDNGKPLRMVGATNAQGHPAVFGLADQTGTALVFYVLDSWADTEGTLRVALSDLAKAPVYAEAGQLHVWFLNEEQVVWEREIAWPGKTKPQVGGAALPAKTTGEKPAAAEKDSVRGDAKATAAQPSSAADKEKPATGFDPFWKAPAKPSAPSGPAPPEVVAPPVTTETKPTTPSKEAKSAAPESKPAEAKAAEIKPVETKPAETKPVKTDILEMNVDEAAHYIDKTWGSGMNPKVARIWKHGMTNYFHTENPEAVRVDVFMTLVKNCFSEQEPGDLRNAFAVLFQKLKERSGRR